MYAAVGSGLVQGMIGESALAAQERIERGEEQVVGVNCYRVEGEEVEQEPPYRPDPEAMRAHVEAFRRFKADRSGTEVARAIGALRAAARDERRNVFEQVVEAAGAGVTHGEIVGALREELGFGDPLIVM
jgi:methylmalonyl-CoA mutase N-terminal domain/subunit